MTPCRRFGARQADGSTGEPPPGHPPDARASRSFQSKADQLNKKGIPRAHGGDKWYASTVRAVLTGQRAKAATPRPPRPGP
jgi:hypothetical protein